MFYEMNNGMEVEVDYDVDPHDRKCVEICSVKWRDVEIMSALMGYEMTELYGACFEDAEEWRLCALEDRADALKDGS